MDMDKSSRTSPVKPAGGSVSLPLLERTPKPSNTNKRSSLRTLRIEDFTEEEQDAIKAFDLKYRFADHALSDSWPWWQMAGIEFKEYKYQCPVLEVTNGVRLSLETHRLVELLDRSAMLPLSGVFANWTSQRPLLLQKGLDEFSPEILTYGKELRRRIVLARFTILKDSDKSIITPVAERNAKITDSRPTYKDDQKTIHKKRSRRSTSSAQDRSVTVFDRGADQMMKHPSSKKKKKGLKHDDTELHSERTPFPSIREVITEYESILKDAKVDMTCELEEPYMSSFRQWDFLLSTGYSVVLYGVGSKEKLLHEFTLQLEDGDVLELRGYNRGIQFAAILDLLVDRFLGGVEPSSTGAVDSTRQRAARVGRAIASRSRDLKQPLYLIIHSIDGTNLRHRAVQDCFATLVKESLVSPSRRGIRFLASVDHINSTSLLWSTKAFEEHNFVMHPTHTYRPYANEMVELELSATKTRPRRGSSKEKGLQQEESFLSTYKNVLDSLTRRNTEVLQVLARMQLDLPTQQQDFGSVGVKDFMQQCKNHCLVTNDTDFRTYLGELTSHNLVQSQRVTKERGLSLRIQATRDQLEEILLYRNSS